MLRRWQVICFLVGLSAGLVGIDARATYGARVSADEPQYLTTAISLYEDFDLDIRDELDAQRFLPFHEAQLNQQTIDLNDDGQRLSPHDPLLPMIIAVPMGLWGWPGAKATLAVLAGLTAVATFTLSTRRFGVAPRIAALIVLAFFIGSPFASYGAQIYPAMPAALAMTLGALAVTGTMSSRKSAVAVLSIVALPWLSVKYVPIAGVLGTALVWQHWKIGNRQALIAVGGALALAGISYAAIHQRIWGGWTVYASGDHFVGGEFEVVGTNAQYWARSNRLLGLLIDRYFGVAAWSPAFLFMPAGIYSLARRHRDHPEARTRGFDALVLIAAVAVGWAVATWVALTMHGWWWSGRQIVPILPLVVVAISTLVDRVRTLLWPTLVLGLVGFVNWAWIAIEASTGRRALIVDHEETSNPLFQAWKYLLPDHRVDALGDQIITTLWGAAFAVSVVWTWRQLRRPDQENTAALVMKERRALTTSSRR